MQYINKEDPNSASTIANKWGHAYFNIDFHFPGSTRSCSSCIPLFVHNCEACIKLKIKQKPVELKLESYQIPPPCSNQKPDMLSVCSEFCKNILKLVMKVTLKICTLVYRYWKVVPIMVQGRKKSVILSFFQGHVELLWNFVDGCS